MLTNQANVDRHLSEVLCSTIALVCNRQESQVSPATSLVELNMDSLTFISVLAQIEAAYDVEFETEEILEFLSASSIRELSGMVGHHLRRWEGQ